jgi:outer membrane protein assembly factor BamB
MSHQCAFSVIDRQLLIADASTGQVIWHGEPLGFPVEEVVPVPGADRAVVLLDYMGGKTGPFENLICVDCEGHVVWRAQLPSASSTEAYVSFEVRDDKLLAHTWSGHRVTLDLANGAVRDAKFTK